MHLIHWCYVFLVLYNNNNSDVIINLAGLHLESSWINQQFPVFWGGEDESMQKGGSVQHMNQTGAWTTPKQHTHTKNLNTLSPTIHAQYFEFGVLKVLENTQILFSRINFIDLFMNFCV